MPPTSHVPRLPTWAGAFVAIVVVCAFSRCVTNDFTWWDDQNTIHQNPWFNQPTLVALVHFWTSIEAGLYVPVTYSVLALLAPLARLSVPEPDGIAYNPLIFHGVSVLAHAAASVVCLYLLRALLARAAGPTSPPRPVVWPAVIGALVFGLHPLQVESVAWASGLKDILAGLFGLVALERFCAALALRERHAKQRTCRIVSGTALLFFLLAVLSKPSAVMIAPIAAVVGVMVYGVGLMAVARSLAAWVVIAIVTLAVARIAQTTSGVEPIPVWSRPFMVGRTLTFYLRQCLLPLSLANDYGMRPSAVMASPLFYAAWLIPLAVAGAIAASRVRLLVVAGLVFVLAPLAVLGVADFQYAFYSVTADHYLYTALLGVALASAWGAWRWRAARWVLAGLLVLWGGRTVDQQKYWSSDRALWTHTLAVNPDSFQAELALSEDDTRAGNRQLAFPRLHRAIALQPAYLSAYRSLADAYLSIGRPDLADQQYTLLLQAVRDHFDDATPRRLADECMFAAEQFAGAGASGLALKYVDEALAYTPDNPRIILVRRALAARGSASPESHGPG